MGGDGLSVLRLQLHHQSGKPDINAPGRKVRIRGGHHDHLFGKADHDFEKGKSIPFDCFGSIVTVRGDERRPVPYRRSGQAAAWPAATSVNPHAIAIVLKISLIALPPLR